METSVALPSMQTSRMGFFVQLPRPLCNRDPLAPTSTNKDAIVWMVGQIGSLRMLERSANVDDDSQVQNDDRHWTSGMRAFS
jgi:hypothetical protein